MNRTGLTWLVGAAAVGIVAAVMPVALATSSIYMSTTHHPVRTGRPASLHSVITDYGDGHVVEHFPSPADRQQCLVERAEQFFGSLGDVPTIVLDGSDGVCSPASRLIPVR